MRIALSASQSQIIEPITPPESENGVEQEQTEGSCKHGHLHQLEMAQEAVLSAIGFMSENERLKKGIERREKDIFSMTTAAGLVNYHMPLPLTCQRYQILVSVHLEVEAEFRHFDTMISRISLCFEIVGEELARHYYGLECPLLWYINWVTPLVCIIFNREWSISFASHILPLLEDPFQRSACDSAFHWGTA